MKLALSLFIFSAIIFTQTFALDLSLSSQKVCMMSSYERVPFRMASFLNSCQEGFEKISGLCYPECEKGDTKFGKTCFKQCPVGYLQCGQFCTRDVTCEKVEDYEILLVSMMEATERNAFGINLNSLICAH